jgi:hypothetical protein
MQDESNRFGERTKPNQFPLTMKCCAAVFMYGVTRS